jgi:hypothetical protein
MATRGSKSRPSKTQKLELPPDAADFQFGGSVTGFGGRHVRHNYPQFRRSPMGAGLPRPPRLRPAVGIRDYAKGGNVKP